MTGISEKSQKILDEMKPLGEFLMENRPMTRALGRTQYVNRMKQNYMTTGVSAEEAEKLAYDRLREFDKEWAEKNAKFNRLSSQYRKSRAADEGGKLL